MFLFLLFLMAGEASTPAVSYKIHSITTSVISGKILADHSWFFLKDGDRIEKRALKGDGVMIWRKGVKSEMTMAKLSKGHLIEYTAGDLATIGFDRTWLELAQPVPGAKLLDQLTKTDEAEINGHRVHVYAGVLGEARYLIHWSQVLGTVVLFQEEASGRKRVVRIEQVLKPGELKPFKANEYPRMDFADVGDNEWMHDHTHNH